MMAAKQARLRPHSLTEVTRYLCGPYFKPLHRMPLDTITRRDVAARVVAIARESGSPTAARARGALSAFFAWAMTMGLCEHNPTIGSAKPAESKPRARVLSDAELVAIWKATGDGMEHSKIVRLLILSACRRSEIGDLRWTEIAPDLSGFTIPAARSKNGRAHTLLLPSMAREIIESVPRMATRDQLFGQRSHGFTRWVQDKRALDERSGVVNWMVHDIRRSVATKMADIGVQPHIIEAVLNHYSGHRAGVAGTYNRSPYANEMRNALAVWHDHLRTIIAGGERKVLTYPQAAT